MEPFWKMIEMVQWSAGRVGRRLAPVVVVHRLGDLFTAVLAVSSPAKDAPR